MSCVLTQVKCAYVTVMHTEFVSMWAADSGKCNTCKRYVITSGSEVSLSEGNFLDYFHIDIFFMKIFGFVSLPEQQQHQKAKLL